jgi:hypothetical protein
MPQQTPCDSVRTTHALAAVGARRSGGTVAAVRFGLADRSICWKVCFAPAHSEVREMLAEADGPHHVLLSWVWPACDGGADIVAFELQARFHCAVQTVRPAELLSERLGVWQSAPPGAADEEWSDMPCDQS